ncbi:hypothetical protein BT67DRAFT_456490 [Trichocladium antarcticum]|uniref:Protein YOP1 n=1 Tax=Trichocladium antarcticum TaxID=1450529 RepID=A0AAN6UJ45_9PEZI|nr:hypothetical protein BT67DRAFT_456490 [Trichocladium antarcticum]
MFDIFAKLLSSLASFLFPLFASYKALKTGDSSQLTPWLMYWVVLACVLLVESWTEWFLFWIPLYAYIRLIFLLYLVLPQTQGARYIYEEYIHPRLEENESAIEEFIASAHERLRSAGIAYIKRAIELLRTNVLGLPPSPAAAAAPPEPQTPQSYTQSLLARFTLPSPRWAAATQGPHPQPHTQPAPNAGLTADFYNLLASAVTSATTKQTPANTRSFTPGTGPGPSVQPRSGLLPDSITALGATARMSFIQAQRERLHTVMSALDREAEEAAAAARQRDGDGGGEDGGSGNVRRLSVASGLSKRTRSEGDFEKLDLDPDAGSGEEEEGDDVAHI